MVDTNVEIQLMNSTQSAVFMCLNLLLLTTTPITLVHKDKQNEHKTSC